MMFRLSCCVICWFDVRYVVTFVWWLFHSVLTCSGLSRSKLIEACDPGCRIAKQSSCMPCLNLQAGNLSDGEDGAWGNWGGGSSDEEGAVSSSMGHLPHVSAQFRCSRLATSWLYFSQPNPRAPTAVDGPVMGSDNSHVLMQWSSLAEGAASTNLEPRPTEAYHTSDN